MFKKCLKIDFTQFDEITDHGLDSRLHSVGSRTVLQKFLKNAEFRSLLRILSLPSPEREDVVEAGQKILLVILGAKHEKTLDELRSRK
jgi:ABC-type enterochelin transport system substrate-binding protein